MSVYDTMPSDSLLTTELDREKYTGESGGAVDKVLNPEQLDRYDRHKTLLDEMILKPINAANLDYNQTMNFLNNEKGDKRFVGFKGMDMTNLQVVNSIITDLAAVDEQSAVYLEDYFENYMGHLVTSTFGAPAHAYTLSSDYTDKELLKMLDELQTLNTDINNLKSKPNSEGVWQQGILHKDGYYEQVPINAWEETLNGYKKLAQESKDLEADWKTKQQLYDKHLNVFDEATNEFWFGTSMGNVFTPSFWTDERTSGLEGLMMDISSAFAGPIMHTYDAIEELWGGEDVYDSDQWQYNPLTGGYGHSPNLARYKKEAEAASRAYKTHYEDNYEAIEEEGKNVLDKAARFKELKGIIETSGYDELMEWMDMSDIRDMLEGKSSPIK